MRRRSVGILGVALLLGSLLTLEARGVEGAFAFAAPAFQKQWQQGEAIVPNFWGPLSTARDGQSEPYLEAQGGQRTVQYFDKGRMELTQPEENAPVTSGLLATELVKGQIQVGNNSFQPKASPAIAIAGDPGSDTGATYAGLATTASAFLAPAQAKVGSVVTNQITPTGAPGSVALPPIAATTILAFDTPTQHNVPTAFANYRATAGLLNIGYAISEPFWATVHVAGASRFVMMQIFERRALTYTDTNPDPFKVEMGNIGQHYYQWRYSTPSTPSTPPTPPAGVISAPTFSNIADTVLTVNYTSLAPVCGSVEYRVQGTGQWTSDVGTLTCTAGTAATSFSIPIGRLQANTTYEMRPAVKNLSQNVSYGPIGVVTTLAGPAVQVSNLTVASVTPTTVTLSFTTSAPTCAGLQYRVTGKSAWGQDVNIDSVACKASDASQTHNKALTGISPGASLDVRAIAKDPAGNLYYSDPITIATPTS